MCCHLEDRRSACELAPELDVQLHSCSEVYSQTGYDAIGFDAGPSIMHAFFSTFLVLAAILSSFAASVSLISLQDRTSSSYDSMRAMLRLSISGSYSGTLCS